MKFKSPNMQTQKYASMTKFKWSLNQKFKSLKGSKITIENSELTHIGGRNVSGGALFTESGTTIKIKDSIFSNNATVQGYTYGGAIYIAGGNDEILPEIENTQFIKNHAID